MPAPSHRIVALVSSVGGLDATTRVLAPLPAGFAPAVVVLQHGEPDHRSELAQILDARTALPVRDAHDGAALAGGAVVVAPNGSHTLVAADGTIALIRSGVTPPNRPSADLLLASMAVCFGARAVAVVLSGTGHDGATGVVAIRRFGGTVIASDEATSTSPGMPAAAVATDSVDAVLPLDAIAAALLDLG